MNAIVGTPTYLTIHLDMGWVDISPAMRAGGYYQILPHPPGTAWVLAADVRPEIGPEQDHLGLEVGQDADLAAIAGNIWKYTGQPIWARTHSRQPLTIKIVERG